MNRFEKYHPITNFIYFSFVIIFSMFNTHPVFLFISFLSALTYSFLLNGFKNLKFVSFIILSMIIFALFINPLFNHRGITILFYLRNGNPITLESIIYGAYSAVMISTVILWFSCFNRIITGDKIIFITGKILPSLSLVISMIFRFVPKFKQQYKIALASQKAIHPEYEESILIKFRIITKVISIMITWSLENAIDTSDSMRSRGYGIKKRTSFHLFKLDLRDFIFISVFLIVGVFILISMQHNFQYFPVITDISFKNSDILTYTLFLVFCFMPIIVDCREVLKWK